MALYFAYGSNMLRRQMAYRCPGAQALGVARLDGWRFAVTASGGANIRTAPDDSVYGVLWDCTNRHIVHLDQWEGVAQGHYIRRRVVLAEGDSDGRSVLVYVSPHHYQGRPRAEYMMNAVIPGARSFGLPETFIEELESWLPANPIGGQARRYLGRRMKAKQE